MSKTNQSANEKDKSPITLSITAKRKHCKTTNPERFAIDDLSPGSLVQPDFFADFLRAFFLAADFLEDLSEADSLASRSFNLFSRFAM